MHNTGMGLFGDKKSKACCVPLAEIPHLFSTMAVVIDGKGTVLHANSTFDDAVVPKSGGVLLFPLLRNARISGMSQSVPATRSQDLALIRSLTIGDLVGTEALCELSVEDGRALQVLLLSRPLAHTDDRWVVRLRPHAARQTAQQPAAEDAVTGLPGRDAFNMQGHTFHDPEHICLAVLDLDGFKLVNDTLGHPAGDQLLREVGERIKAAIAHSSTPIQGYRLGGDEFAFLAEGISIAEFKSWLRALLMRLSDPYTVHGAPVSVGGSVGVAVGSMLGENSGLSPQEALTELYRKADVAMYAAKQGRERITIWSEPLDHRAHKHLKIVAHMSTAFELKEMHLEYQPIVPASDRRLPPGKEGLMRWRHFEYGTMPAASFLSAVRLSGFRDELALTALKQAVEDLSKRQQAAAWVSINMHPGDLLSPPLFRKMHAYLKTATPDVRKRLVIEITEHEEIDDIDALQSSMKVLRKLGIRFLLDDFGTGYAALDLLFRLPLMGVKLDRSLIASLSEGASQAIDAKRERFLGELVALMHGQGLLVIAEGIETPAEHRLAMEAGVDYLQGYAIQTGEMVISGQQDAATPGPQEQTAASPAS